MNNLTISIFDNSTLFEIISEIDLFSKFKIKHYTNLDLCLNDAKKGIFLVILSANSKLLKSLNTDTLEGFPSLIITVSKEGSKIVLTHLSEKIQAPFTITQFENKIISLFSKYEFNQNSFIQLDNFVIDKNERKIKKNNLELQLSEKEINFLILFSKTKNPVSKKFLLKNVWNYSLETETHTVETHIHRLRKKILEKFGEKNFIKNNNKGYYI